MNIQQKAELLAHSIHDSDKSVLEKQYNDLSWSGQDPVRVIALALVLGRNMTQYRHAVHLTSSYYSQIKHLLKKGKLLSSMFCLTTSIDLANSVPRIAEYTLRKEKKPIDLEVAGAPYFLLSRIPVFGVFFKEQAISFLVKAEKELYAQPGLDPLEASIIWSKLYVLTKNEDYRSEVKNAGLHINMNHDQLARIGSHLGFKDVRDFYDFCNMVLCDT